ncbi:hypothetical protein ACP3V3_19680 [Vibrio sp. PNB22_3_1]
MTSYLVKWEIDIDAETPEEAVLEAIKIQRDRGSQALAFDVVNEADDESKFIDLSSFDLICVQISNEIKGRVMSSQSTYYVDCHDSLGSIADGLDSLKVSVLDHFKEEDADSCALFEVPLYEAVEACITGDPIDGITVVRIGSDFYDYHLKGRYVQLADIERE